MNWHYDNGIEPNAGNPNLFKFERIYCIRLHELNEEQWKELDNIYKSLPGERFEKEVPYWFGMDEPNPPYLSASIEPHGLQVAGVLPLDDWLEWDEVFRKQVEASSLPIYET